MDVTAAQAHATAPAAEEELTTARLARVGDLEVRRLLYLGTGRDGVRLAAAAGTRVFLLGGEPLGETLLMWWNFVGRTPEDIITAAAGWAQGERFGTVPGYHGVPLAAPPLDAVRLGRRR